MASRMANFSGLSDRWALRALLSTDFACSFDESADGLSLPSLIAFGNSFSISPTAAPPGAYSVWTIYRGRFDSMSCFDEYMSLSPIMRHSITDDTE